jgi:hypothetical protein
MAIDYAKKAALDKKYIGVVFKGSVFPDAPYKYTKVILNPEIKNEYIPARDKVLKEATLGSKLLCTIFAFQEGYRGKTIENKDDEGDVISVKRTGTRSYVTCNPGNIGNTDNGGNTTIGSLEAGVLLQYNFFKNIAAGGNTRYPMGKVVKLKPFYSKEIDNHPEYGLPCNLPGYEFTFTGQLDQLIKIYSTGARAGNNYLNRIVSFFADHGFTITAETTIQEILLLDRVAA